MELTKKQRQYLEKNLSQEPASTQRPVLDRVETGSGGEPLENIAKAIGVSVKDLKNYLQTRLAEAESRRETTFAAVQGKHGLIAETDSGQILRAGTQNRDVETTDWRGWIKENKRILLFLAALVFAAYANGLFNDFVSDDISGIAQNKLLDSPDFIFSAPPSFFHPTLLFIINKIFGKIPLFYRLLNVGFHLGTVYSGYLLVSLLVNKKTAILTACLFAVHPILTESVTWISGGGHIFYSFFVLLSLLLYFLSSQNRKFFIFSLVAFSLALCASEKAIVLPILIVVMLFSFGRLKAEWPRLVPFFGLAGLYFFSRLGLLSQRMTDLQNVFYQEPQISNPLFQIPVAISSYLGLIFWPRHLTLYHSEMSFTMGQYFFYLAVLLGFLGFLGWAVFKNRRIAFFGSLFLISLLPTLTPLGISWIVAERYVYLGTFGILVLVAMGIERVREVRAVRGVGDVGDVRGRLHYFLFGVLIVILTGRTIIRNMDWQNQDTLWLATAKASPSSPQNHNNLGDLYGRRGDLEKSAEEFKKAIELKPNYGDAYHNLANTYQQMGKTDLAIENYEKALLFNPRLWQSRQNLAAIYFSLGDMAKTTKEMEEAVKINPRDVNLLINLGGVYLKTGDKGKAKEIFSRVLAIDPGNERAREGMQGLR
ncbi:MAG: tetratricopeptide repeat protein [bacterium]|nr:tetratricopeptide repeat protein [bacterium]